MELYGAYKQVDPQSAANAREQEKHGITTFHNGQIYDVGVLLSDSNIQLPNNYFSSLVQLNSRKKRLPRDTTLKENYAKTINEDLEKVTRSKFLMYLPAHPVINPNKPGKMRRVLNDAAKFHGTSLNKYLLTGPDLSQS